MADMEGMEEVREQDRFLPIANISRIMKKSLPANAKIAKDAKETVQECVSEFISFITSEASDKCQQEKRKTINGDDLLWAMSTLGFDKYVEPLKAYLAKYRESVKGGDKPDSSRKKGGEEHHVPMMMSPPPPGPVMGGAMAPPPMYATTAPPAPQYTVTIPQQAQPIQPPPLQPQPPAQPPVQPQAPAPVQPQPPQNFTS